MPPFSWLEFGRGVEIGGADWSAMGGVRYDRSGNCRFFNEQETEKARL